MHESNGEPRSRSCLVVGWPMGILLNLERRGTQWRRLEKSACWRRDAGHGEDRTTTRCKRVARHSSLLHGRAAFGRRHAWIRNPDRESRGRTVQRANTHSRFTGTDRTDCSSRAITRWEMVGTSTYWLYAEERWKEGKMRFLSSNLSCLRNTVMKSNSIIDSRPRLSYMPVLCRED